VARRVRRSRRGPSSRRVSGPPEARAPRRGSWPACWSGAGSAWSRKPKRRSRWIRARKRPSTCCEWDASWRSRASPHCEASSESTRGAIESTM
jgi:hypothetical protein